MARKLVPLEEAATQLGVTPDELNEMRQRNEIYGYRDGASWKFKPEDVERLAAERAARGSAAAPAPANVADSTDDGDDMVLLSEVELGGSGVSSTVIGKPGEGQKPEDSDIQLAIGQPEGSTIGGASDVLPVDLSDDLPVDLGSETVDLAGSAAGKPGSSKTGGSGKPGSSKKISDKKDGSSKKIKGSGGDMTLDQGATGSDLTVAPPAGPQDVFSLKDDGGSSDLTVQLAGADSPGSGTGSDITVSPHDSGISLVDASDSGLSLEEPLELSSADEDESSFDLSSDSSGDSSGSSGTLDDSSEFDSDAVMELKGEDDFLLTPLEESVDEESQDSGSQVIALDSESELDDLSPTQLATPPGATSLLEADDVGAVVDPLAAGALAPTPTLAMGPQAMVPAVQTQFGVGVIIALSACVLFMAMSGMMMFDLVRNMWSWDTPYAANSFLMDAILNIIG